MKRINKKDIKNKTNRRQPQKTNEKPTEANINKKPVDENIEKLPENMVPVQIKDHKDSNGGHPHVIMDNIDDKHVSVGMTTRPKKGHNHPNYRLQNNPLNDHHLVSYIRRNAIVAPKKDYHNPRHGTMTSEDYKKAKEYAEKAKQKYIEEKKKK